MYHASYPLCRFTDFVYVPFCDQVPPDTQIYCDPGSGVVEEVVEVEVELVEVELEVEVDVELVVELVVGYGVVEVEVDVELVVEELVGYGVVELVVEVVELVVVHSSSQSQIIS